MREPDKCAGFEWTEWKQLWQSLRAARYREMGLTSPASVDKRGWFLSLRNLEREWKELAYHTAVLWAEWARQDEMEDLAEYTRRDGIVSYQDGK